MQQKLNCRPRARAGAPAARHCAPGAFYSMCAMADGVASQEHGKKKIIVDVVFLRIPGYAHVHAARSSTTTKRAKTGQSPRYAHAPDDETFEGFVSAIIRRGPRGVESPRALSLHAATCCLLLSLRPSAPSLPLFAHFPRRNPHRFRRLGHGCTLGLWPGLARFVVLLERAA